MKHWRWLTLAALAVAGSAHADPILAGPMVGHVTESTAFIWVRLAEGARIKEVKGGSGKVVDESGATRSFDTLFSPSTVLAEMSRCEWVGTDDLGDGMRVLHIGGLRGDASCGVSVEVEGPDGTGTRQVEFRTAPPPRRTGKIRFAFGSCAEVSEGKKPLTLDAVADEAPDFMIFLGDNNYFIVGDGGPDNLHTSGPTGEWDFAEKKLARHLELKNTPEFGSLMRKVPCYAIWDDHDFGPNDSDGSFPGKADSLRVFKQVWANPSYGTSDQPGIFSSFRRGPVEVFLMDDRYNKATAARHKEIGPEDGAIWGEAELKWLMAGLKNSTAPVKFIANGTQVLSEGKGGEGHFQEARKERDRLLDFIKENKIGGVIFLTGDRHYTECNRLQREGAADVLEFTSSPLAQGDKSQPLFARLRTQLWAMKGDSYGLVTVDIPEPGKGTIRFEARDEDNHVPIINAGRCVQTFELRSLQY